MDTRFDISLMVKVSEMYYNDGLRQEQIAKELNISRSLISMILTEAKDIGIVEIKVKNPLLNHEYYSLKLKEQFNLDKCFIVPTSIQDKNVLRKLSVQRAISVFDEEIKDNYKVGISWGRTTFEFINNYKNNKKVNNINIVPLIGGSNQFSNYFQLNEMVRVFAEKIGGKPNFIYAPALTTSKEEKEMFVKSPFFERILELWNSLDIIISGIGILPENIIDREKYVGETEMYTELKGNNAIGDVLTRYYDSNGNFISDQYYEKVIVIPIKMIKKVPTKIFIVSGKEKAKAIIGALKTGEINYLISDEQTAKVVTSLI